jgi:hypothetical protein
MAATREAMCLHLPPGLKDSLRLLATRNKRSMTREIELAVETHVIAARNTAPEHLPTR